jgi:hypothetical protein
MVLMNKKASLNLSINAIVILILAITMLGLGLAFMRNIFGQATGEFTEISGEVQKQMITQMKESSKVVDLSGAVYKIKSGEKKMAYIGFKNMGNEPKDFLITSITGSSLSGQNSCGTSEEEVFIEYKDTPTTVQSGATLVLPMNLKVSANADKDSCFFEIKINSDYKIISSGEECNTPGCSYGSLSPRLIGENFLIAGNSCKWWKGSLSDECGLGSWDFRNDLETDLYCSHCNNQGNSCTFIGNSTTGLYILPPGSYNCADYLDGFNTLLEQPSHDQSIQLTVNVE